MYWKLIIVIILGVFFYYSPVLAHACNWHWDSPLPQGNNLNGVWGAASLKYFAVGKFGTIIYYNGSTWITMETPVRKELYSVWGSYINDVYAVGDTVLLHYNGSVWSQMTYPGMEKLFGVWGESSSDELRVTSDELKLMNDKL